MNNSQWYLNCLSFIIAIIMGMILIKNEKGVAAPFFPVKEFNKTIILVLLQIFICNDTDGI